MKKRIKLFFFNWVKRGGGWVCVYPWADADDQPLMLCVMRGGGGGWFMPKLTLLNEANF